MSWPKSCEAWATALFDIIKKNSIDKAFGKTVQDEIFALVQETTKNGTLWTRNWDEEPPVPTAAKLLIAQGLYVPSPKVVEITTSIPISSHVPPTPHAISAVVDRPQHYTAHSHQTTFTHGYPQAVQHDLSQQQQRYVVGNVGYNGYSGGNDSTPQNSHYFDRSSSSAWSAPIPTQSSIPSSYSSFPSSSPSTLSYSSQPSSFSSSSTATSSVTSGGLDPSPKLDNYTKQLLEQQKLEQQKHMKRPRQDEGTEVYTEIFFNQKKKKKNKPIVKMDVSKFDAYTKVIPLKDIRPMTSAMPSLSEPDTILTESSKHSIDPRAQEDSRALGSRSKRFATSSSFPSEAFDKHTILNTSEAAQSRIEDLQLEQSSQRIVGTCEVLEKRYFRLIGPPHPSSVRPEGVLKKALASLVSKHREGVKYLYISDQLKSIRQDLSVQHIRDAFTVEVYEFNARLALENGDPGEFNQCQTQLEVLYKAQDELVSKEGKDNNSKDETNASLEQVSKEGKNESSYITLLSRRLEFSSYRILYSLYTGDPTDPSVHLSRLTSLERNDPWVRHSMNVVAAFVSDNFSRFFSLYRSAPNMSSYLMDWLSHKIRTRTLLSLSRSVKTHIPISFLRTSLCFTSDSDCATFLSKMGAKLVDKSSTDGSSLTSSTDKIIESQNLSWETASTTLKPFKDALMTALHEEVQRDGAGVFF